MLSKSVCSVFVQCLAQRDPTTAPAPRCYGNTNDAATSVSSVIASSSSPFLLSLHSALACLACEWHLILPCHLVQSLYKSLSPWQCLWCPCWGSSGTPRDSQLNSTLSLKALWLPASVSFFILTASLASCKDGKCKVVWKIKEGLAWVEVFSLVFSPVSC